MRIATVSTAADQIAQALEAALWLGALLMWLVIAAAFNTWTWCLGEALNVAPRWRGLQAG